MVLIPDIFESFMSREPVPNAHYEIAREEALNWAITTCKYNTEEGKRMRQGDFAYFGAVMVPDARVPELRTVVDWLNWVFVFDDQLDDGPLGRKREAACKYIDGALAVLREHSPREKLQPIQWVLQDIWGRIRESQCSPGVKNRWLQHQKQYLEALRDAIGFAPSTTLEETLSKYFEYRFHSIGIFVLYSLVEYACGLELPDKLFDNPSIIELERIGVEIQIIANDCVSFHREKDQDCPHNIIYLFHHHGMSEQEAYDRCQLMLRERYREWYLALANLQIYGEKIDKQVHRYIKGIQDVASANAHWSFRTERYFGKNRKQIRETRVLNDGKMDWVPAIMLAENIAINQGLEAESE